MAEDASSSDEAGDHAVSFESLPGHYRLPCNQCLFYNSPAGCQKGDSCNFCHHTVTAQETVLSSHRPRNKRRKNLQKAIWQLLQQVDPETQTPQEVVDQLQQEAHRTEYARWICQRGVAYLVSVRGFRSRASGEGNAAEGRCKALHCFAV
eukprot:s105_g29.t1